VQNSAEVKDILGKTATLEFRLVDATNDLRRRCVGRAAGAQSCIATATATPCCSSAIVTSDG
jgi:preprotein translocase subunit SecD